mgnify:CR=1 FL=1
MWCVVSCTVHLSYLCIHLPVWMDGWMVAVGIENCVHHLAHALVSHTNALVFFLSLFTQYYEMSYGLNVEMHKQVSVLDLSPLSMYLCASSSYS